MAKSRMEAFSDGVLAIIITIMVLEIKVPQGEELSSVSRLFPHLISYAVSFGFIGIYWNNHHHLLQAVHKINGKVLWANLHLLFWLSLIPVATGWVGHAHFASGPVAIYGTILFLSGFSYYLLTHALIACPEANPLLAEAVGKDFKGKLSVIIYAIAIPIAFWNSYLAYGFYVLVALLWLIPDRRIERVLQK